MLDSDTEGERQKQRYGEEFGVLVEGRLFTLGDVESEWSGRSMEGLFETVERESIQKGLLPGRERIQ